MIKAIMFDFWGTLVTGAATEAATKEANKLAHEYLHKCGYNISYKEYSKRKAEAFKYYEIMAAKKIYLKPEDLLKKRIFHDLNVNLRDIEKIIYINDIYDREIKFRHDCGTVLKKLKDEGYKIALVSNSWLIRGRHLLNKEKLSKYFDAIVLSSEVGFGKPDKLIFELAARKLKVPLSQCAYVGDDHRLDIKAAYNAGIECAIAIEPFEKDPALALPTAIVMTLSEILSVIERFPTVKSSNSNIR